jgi:radical SAM superfamily enzyme YgiQ (UPF0313 family)
MDTSDTIALPLSLLLISGKLADDPEFNITIIDQRLERNWEEQLEKRILSSKILCVGLSTMTGTQIAYALKAAEMVRKIDPKIPLIWGGVHPTLAPLETIEDPLVDIVVAGEGEETFPELVYALNKNANLGNVAGIFYKSSSGNLVTTQERNYSDVNNPPKIPYKLINIENYFYDIVGSKALPMLFSRGCPHRCGFCYRSKSIPPAWRPLPLDYILREIKNLQNLGAKTIIPLDDNFFVDKKRVTKICNILKEENISVSFHVNCRVDYVDAMDEAYLENLVNNGFVSWDFGIESGSQKTLDYMKKDIKIEQILRVNKKLQRLGIVPTYSFMGGFYGETYSNLKETINLMFKLIDDYPEAYVSPIKVYTPFPDTRMIDDLPESYYKRPKTLRQWANYDYNTPHITWHNKKKTKLLEKISYYTYFIDIKRLSFIFGKNFLSRYILKIYSSIARMRLKKDIYYMPLDFYAMKLFYFLRK